MRVPRLLLTCTLLLGIAHAADLSGVKTYLDRHISTQISGAATLKQAADTYYAAAKAANFNYRALTTQPTTRAALKAARAGWQQASPAYENIEGIVAGVPTLASFDLNLDAGTSSGEDAVTFDLTLPGGKVLKKPGNLFGVTEGTLWGTVPAYRAGVPFDVNGNGRADFGDQLPDALVLKAAADALHTQSLALQKAARAWSPTRADVFGALVGNVPTVGPVFFEDWKSSPFVLGTRSDRRDFVVISRLRDLQGNVASWRAMYAGLHGDVKAKDAALDTQISAGLTELAAFVDRLVAREAQRRYTPEQAETLQREAQNRATVLTGRLSQAAARLGVTLP